MPKTGGTAMEFSALELGHKPRESGPCVLATQMRLCEGNCTLTSFDRFAASRQMSSSHPHMAMASPLASCVRYARSLGPWYDVPVWEGSNSAFTASNTPSHALRVSDTSGCVGHTYMVSPVGIPVATTEQHTAPPSLPSPHASNAFISASVSFGIACRCANTKKCNTSFIDWAGPSLGKDVAERRVWMRPTTSLIIFGALLLLIWPTPTQCMGYRVAGSLTTNTSEAMVVFRRRFVTERDAVHWMRDNYTLFVWAFSEFQSPDVTMVHGLTTPRYLQWVIPPEQSSSRATPSLATFMLSLAVFCISCMCCCSGCNSMSSLPLRRRSNLHPRNRHVPWFSARPHAHSPAHLSP